MRDRILIAIVLAWLTVGGSLALAASHATSVVAPVTTPKDSRVFPPFLKQAIPNVTINTGDAVNFNLKDYYAAGDVNVTSTAIVGCEDIAPTFTAGGTILPGTALTQTDKNNAVWGGTATGSNANNTYTIKVTNCSDAVTGFTDSIDWVVVDDAEAPAGTVIPEGGVNYFVCPGGSDSSPSGNTLAGRWATVGKINGAFSPTTTTRPKVWFCQGSTYSQALTVDWSGNSSDYVKVGTYYTSTGNPATGTAYELVPDNPTAFPTAYTWGNGARAIIKGTYTASCSPYLAYPGTAPGFPCPVGISSSNPAAIPSTQYASLLYVACNYCRVQSIDIENSSGRSAYIGSSAGQTINFHNVQIVNSKFYGSAQDPLDVASVGQLWVYGSIIDMGNLADRRGDHVRDPVTLANAGRGASTIGEFVHEPNAADEQPFYHADILYEKNLIWHDIGENLIVTQVGSVVLRGNVIGESGLAVYGQTCGKCLYEYNLILGGDLQGHTNTPAKGLLSTVEDSFDIRPDIEIIMRGNVASNMSSCFGITTQPLSASNGVKISMKIYNNTCINTLNGIRLGYDGGTHSWTQANIGANGIKVYNNIVYNTPAFAAANPSAVLCNPQVIPAGLTNVTFDYNLWGSTPSNARCNGAHDVIGDPLVPGTHFTDVSWTGTIPTWADFMPGVGSPALGAGKVLTAPVITVSPTEYNINQAAVSPGVSYPHSTLDLTGWSIDYYGRAADGSPDMGALGR